MKKFLLGLTTAALLASCGSSDHGELVGVQDRPTWYPSEPYGMVYIPQGSFTMGNHDEDVPYAYTAPAKVVSIASFYMDQTEITNNEYRQFGLGGHCPRSAAAATVPGSPKRRTKPSLSWGS